MAKQYTATNTYGERVFLTVRDDGLVIARNSAKLQIHSGNFSNIPAAGAKGRGESLNAAARQGLDALNAASRLVWSEVP